MSISLSLLAPNETEPIEVGSAWTCPPEELAEGLVRTGSSSDGSCFFHSLNLAFREFRDANDEEKREFIDHQRRLLASQLDTTEWMTLNQGHFASVQVLQTLRSCIFVLHSVLQYNGPFDEKDDSSAASMLIAWKKEWDPVIKHSAIDIWSRLFPFEYVDLQLLGDWHNSLSQNDLVTIENMREVLLDLSNKRTEEVLHPLLVAGQLREDEAQGITSGVRELWSVIFDHSIFKTLDMLRKRIADVSTWVDMDVVLALAPYLPYDLIFLHAETLEVYFDTVMVSRRQTRPEDEQEVILLLYHPDCHFESLGRVVANPTTKRTKIVRVFSSRDPFILRLRKQKLP